MHTAGIIAEYNPLHLGHEFHITETKRMTGADFTITVLSGDFVQRGLPAVLDKHTRTRMALEAGSDLVLELPVAYALSSGEGFAFGGVSLLHQLGCVDTLSFGSEAGVLDQLSSIARICTDENKIYQSAYQSALKQGLSHPAARIQALSQAYPSLDLSVLYGSSNNMLALEYCKALYSLNSSIQPVTIKRLGQGYLEEALSKQAVFSSATAIRKALMTAQPSEDTQALFNMVSQKTAVILQTAQKEHRLIFPDDLSPLLHYKLLCESTDHLTDYYEITPDFANKLYKALPDFEDFSQFSNLLWTKDLTYARVCRSLLHILLDLKADTCNVHKPVPYARILGFKKTAAPLLSEIKKHSDIPLLSKLADAKKSLDTSSYALLQTDIQAAHIYDSVVFHKSGSRPLHEMRKRLIIL